MTIKVPQRERKDDHGDDSRLPVVPPAMPKMSGRSLGFARVLLSGRKDADGIWQQHTEWYSITAFGPLATRTLDRLVKAACVYVYGRLQVHTWQGAEGRV